MDERCSNSFFNIICRFSDFYLLMMLFFLDIVYFVDIFLEEGLSYLILFYFEKDFGWGFWGLVF